MKKSNPTEHKNQHSQNSNQAQTYFLKWLTTQTSNNPNRTRTQNFGFYSISSCSLANSCPVVIVKIFVMLQKTCHLIYFHRTVCTMLKYIVFYILCIQLSVKIIWDATVWLFTTSEHLLVCVCGLVASHTPKFFRTLDLRSVGQEFESWLLRYRVQPWASC